MLMLSYREKELLMVQSFLKDLSGKFQQSISDVNTNIEERRFVTISNDEFPQVETYSDLVELAQMCGYDTYIRAEDILSQEEIEQLEKEYDAIEQEFKRITKLEKIDLIFIVAATAMQLVRQILQPKLDFENLKKDNRPNDKEAAKNADNKEEIKNKMDENKKKFEEEGGDTNKALKYYWASTEQICQLSVPYDTISGTSKNGKFPFGLNGNNHRFKTLGHDPWLGYIFGTCNILTNTMTTCDLKTVHVKNSTVVKNADTIKMFKYSYQHFEDKKIDVVLALLKQCYHIHSDVKSKKSLPLPFLELLMDSKNLEKLSDYGINYNSLQFVKTIAIQAGFAEFINFIVAVAHRILMAIEEYNENDWDISKIDAIKEYDIFGKKDGIKEVRTRKIMLLSNSIASTINLAYVGVKVVVDVESGAGDPMKDLENLDVGGLLITIFHLFNDTRIISKIKKDFIAQALDEDFKKKLEEIEIIGELN